MSGAGGGPGEAAAARAARERQAYVRHELRAPLAVMFPLLSLLLEGGAGELTPRQRELLGTMQRTVERLDRLVATVVESGWLEAAGAPCAPARVDLDAAVDGVLAVMAAAGREGPPVAVTVAPGGLRPAWADPDDVQSVLLVLLGNAFAYTPATGRVTVRLSCDGAAGAVEAAVSDTGPGVPDDERDGVFAFGVRGSAAAGSGVAGLGVGLWAARELARRNGGDLALDPGAGPEATFRLRLPAAP